MAPSGNELATFLLEAQCLNQLHHRVLEFKTYFLTKTAYWQGFRPFYFHIPDLFDNTYHFLWGLGEFLLGRAALFIIIIIIIFLHGLGRLTCSGIDAMPSFPGASTASSSPRLVVEGMYRESGVVHSFEVVDAVLFVFESHVLYSRDL